MYDIPCVIFAGGKSSRMGEDKALLPFGGFNTLTEFQLHKLQKIFSTVYISTKSKEKFNFQAKFILDEQSDGVFAPTAGFIGVYNTITEDSFFALSVDAPFVGINEIQKIIDADKKGLDAVIAKTEFSFQPMCGIYHRSLENNFKEMLQTNNHKLGFLLKNSNTTFVKFEDEKPFLNLNSPKDYQEALNLI